MAARPDVARNVTRPRATFRLPAKLGTTVFHQRETGLRRRNTGDNKSSRDMTRPVAIFLRFQKDFRPRNLSLLPRIFPWKNGNRWGSVCFAGIEISRDSERETGKGV